MVSKEDLGCNFFVTEDDVGRSRAHVAVSWLNELNQHDSTGQAITMVQYHG